MAGLIASLLLSAAVQAEPKHYPYTIDEPLARPAKARLVWRDEFGGTSLNKAKWRFDTAYNKTGWFNEELQYYSANRPANARVEKGKLVITGRSDEAAIKRYPDWGGQKYSSARIVSRAAWKYGFIEVRAKLPCTGGTWPAIWMLPQVPGEWPDEGEIDIMEHVGKTPGEIHATLHTKSYNHIMKTQREAIKMVPTACSAFHTYQLEWKPDAIRIGVDGRAYLRVANDRPMEGKDAWPFDEKFELILNLALGGFWPGPVDDSKLPQRMEVDYVRVWQSR